MKKIRASVFQRLFNDERGQAAYILSFGIIGLLAVGGMTVDVGHAYMVRNEMQDAANAAALASVDGLYAGGSTSITPSTTILTMAQKYDASPASDNGQTGVNGYNYDPSAGTVTTTITAPCLASQLVGVSSCTASNWNNQSNAVRVTETAVVPTTLMRVFGVKTLTVSGTATALPKGKTAPYNIALILDATPSMASIDPGCDGNTEEQCALNAFEGMLGHIYPCIGTASCTANGEYAAVRVSVFSFPNVKTTDLTKDINCSGTPAWDRYTFPKIPPGASTAGYVPISYDGGTTYNTYQITAPSGTTGVDPDANGFSSDYYPGSGGKVLNPNSTFVKIVGNTSTTGTITKGCMTPPTASGTYQTYFAGAIYAAQAALQAEKAVADPLIHAALGTTSISSTNVIIFVSDGQANAGYSQFYPNGSTASTESGLGVGGISVAYGGTTTYSPLSTSKNLANVAGSWGKYPDDNNDCQQAMMAAQYAKNQGTIVFGIAYGSESNGCLSNSNGVDYTNNAALTLSGTFNVPISSYTQIVPCVTIENIADSWAHFFAESSSVGCSGTQMTNPIAGLATIFNQITGDLGPSPRLVTAGVQ